MSSTKRAAKKSASKKTSAKKASKKSAKKTATKKSAKTSSKKASKKAVTKKAAAAAPSNPPPTWSERLQRINRAVDHLSRLDRERQDETSADALAAIRGLRHALKSYRSVVKRAPRGQGPHRDLYLALKGIDQLIDQTLDDH